MTRDEAVEYLNSRGLTAGTRDWSMGETVYVLMGEASNHGGITTYPGLLYLAPIEDGRWAIDHNGRFVEIWPSLQEATKRAADYVAWWVDGLDAMREAGLYYIKLNREILDKKK